MTRGGDLSVVHFLSADAAAAAADVSSESGTSSSEEKQDDKDPEGFCQQEDGLERPWKDSDIPVIGMACKVPGANSADEFWELLAAGKSQHKEIEIGTADSGVVDKQSGRTTQMFAEGPIRATHQDGNGHPRWFANLPDDPGHFDHRFFRKTAREAESMDPQQRLLLQVAYQAVAMSGYLRTRSTDDDAQNKDNEENNVGCYVGLHLNEYEDNVASHTANVFSATGNLHIAPLRVAGPVADCRYSLQLVNDCSSSGVPANSVR